MISEKVSGLVRLYLEPFPLTARVPTVRQLIRNPKKHICFIEHVVQNHKGLNWKCYRYKVTASNYKSFIYAFAYKMACINLNSTSWQLESNARRLNKALKRANISLSHCEKEVINMGLHFTTWYAKEVERKGKAVMLQLKLARQYDMLSEHYYLG